MSKGPRVFEMRPFRISYEDQANPITDFRAEGAYKDLSFDCPLVLIEESAYDAKCAEVEELRAKQIQTDHRVDRLADRNVALQAEAEELVEALSDLEHHVYDYGIERKSIVTAMACERAKAVLSKHQQGEG